MKKYFKTLLLVLLAVPALLLVACSQTITMQEYNDRVAKSAKAYYQEKDGNSMTVTINSNTTNTWKDWVYFGAEDENGLEVDFCSTVVATQKIEIYTSTTGDKYTNIRVTETSKETTTGQEENEAETALESYTEVVESERVVTFVSTIEEGTTSVKAYIVEKTKVDGEAEPEEKSVYTYTTESYGLNAINSIIEDINDDIIEEGFFSLSYILFNLYGGQMEFTANGDNNFGMEFGVSLPTISNKTIIEMSTNGEIIFENNLPKKIVLDAVYNTDDDHIAQEGDMSDMDSNVTRSVEMNYSCGQIAAPEGFENAGVAHIAPSIDMVDINLNIGL